MADTTTPADLERAAFHTLNAVVEPLVRAGLGGPLLTPFGAIVLETTGRKSGRPHRTPLLAAVFGTATIVSTYRGTRSDWVKNLLASPTATWWVNGLQREGHAVVFAPGRPAPDLDSLPVALRPCAETAWPALVASGWAIAVLVAGSSG